VKTRDKKKKKCVKKCAFFFKENHI